MANICTNQLEGYCEVPQTIVTVCDFLQKKFNCDRPTLDLDSNQFTITFDSKWTFPEEIMQELCDILKDEDNKTLSMTVLSVEWGCYYCMFYEYNRENCMFIPQ